MRLMLPFKELLQRMERIGKKIRVLTGKAVCFLRIWNT